MDKSNMDFEEALYYIKKVWSIEHLESDDFAFAGNLLTKLKGKEVSIIDMHDGSPVIVEISPKLEVPQYESNWHCTFLQTWGAPTIINEYWEHAVIFAAAELAKCILERTPISDEY